MLPVGHHTFEVFHVTMPTSHTVAPRPAVVVCCLHAVQVVAPVALADILPIGHRLHPKALAEAILPAGHAEHFAPQALEAPYLPARQFEADKRYTHDFFSAGLDAPAASTLSDLCRSSSNISFLSTGAGPDVRAGGAGQDGGRAAGSTSSRHQQHTQQAT